MTRYAIKVRAISEGTFAIRGYGPKSGITDDGCLRSGLEWETSSMGCKEVPGAPHITTKYT